MRLQCRTCHKSFDFASGETAIVLRLTAFTIQNAGWEDIEDGEEGYFLYLTEADEPRRVYQFTHAGLCAAFAGEWTRRPPGFELCAFGRDLERLRVLDAKPVPHGYLVLVSHGDGSQQEELMAPIEPTDDQPGGFGFIDEQPRVEPRSDTPLRVMLTGMIRPARTSSVASIDPSVRRNATYDDRWVRDG